MIEFTALQLVLLLVCWSAGVWNLSYHYTRWKLRRYVKYHMDKAANEPEYRRVQVKIEKNNETLAAYRVDNNAFIAQSTSGKELVALLKEYFNDAVTRIDVAPEHGRCYIEDFI